MPVAIITGASRGIGFATAAALVRSGFQVVITARHEEPLEAAVGHLDAPGRAIGVAGNSSDPAHRAQVVHAALSEFGRLDVLVNSTGISPVAGPLVDLDLAAARKILDSNVVSTLGWVQEAHVALAESSGAIVNVSSVGGIQPHHGVGMYGVSKAGVIQLTRQLAAELAPAIRVNAVAPGAVKTAFSASLLASEEDRLAATYPLARLGEPQDVAGAIVFLASAPWITGATLIVDGGLLTAEIG